MQIIADDFTLRNWEEKDAEKLASIANNMKIAENLNDGFPHPYSIEDARQFISHSRKDDPTYLHLAIEKESVIIGSIGAYFKENVHRKNVEIGYYLAEEYWGQGIMAKAVRCFTQYLFDNYDIIRVCALPFARNANSRRVLEKQGSDVKPS
ncbi:GNAT family N-acetyltransferase [Methanolobus sediminis]|uniref:GNAT family N-acetyltransferase n=1 Tax=Methanolobus sediminis TaxID=3072978 RepID=A0AA51ULX8_9EURY|nr:GNAT family N-acetyltransferase [Methanolobus sediminis]WMW26018.1 GNAT family N-acetyltransferase [Methanolobus sediminis]